MEEKIKRRYDELVKKREGLRRLAEKPGTKHEGNNAKILLKKLDEKIIAMEKQYGLSSKDVNKDKNTSSAYSQQQRTQGYRTSYSNHGGQTYNQNPYGTDWNVNRNFESEEDKLRRLGIIYVIFGETIKIGSFLVKFLETIKLKEDDFKFCEVKCDIFENDRIVCHNVVIGFWPFKFGDTVCGDMSFAKYRDGQIYEHNGTYDFRHYKPLTDFMKDMWNDYFSNRLPRLTAGYDAYLGESQTRYNDTDNSFGFGAYGGSIIRRR